MNSLPLGPKFHQEELVHHCQVDQTNQIKEWTVSFNQAEFDILSIAQEHGLGVYVQQDGASTPIYSVSRNRITIPNTPTCNYELYKFLNGIGHFINCKSPIWRFMQNNVAAEIHTNLNTSSLISIKALKYLEQVISNFQDFLPQDDFSRVSELHRQNDTLAKQMDTVYALLSNTMVNLPIKTFQAKQQSFIYQRSAIVKEISQIERRFNLRTLCKLPIVLYKRQAWMHGLDELEKVQNELDYIFSKTDDIYFGDHTNLLTIVTDDLNSHGQAEVKHFSSQTIKHNIDLIKARVINIDGLEF